MARKKSSYYGLSRVARIIISIIPILSLIIHLFARLAALNDTLKQVLLVVFHIIFGWNVLWIVDIITTIAFDKIILTNR